jgi:hypothetical protein
MDNKSVLTKAFKALTKIQQGNLKWHVKQGTPICCGESASKYTDMNGGG